MHIRALKTLAVLLVLLCGSLAYAQSPSGVSPSQRLDQARAEFEQIDQTLKRENLTDGTLRDLRARLDPLGLVAQSIIDELSPRLASTKARLDQLGAKEVPDVGFYAVKESVFPFSKFPGVDVVLGPEMRSTGEVMGADRSLPIAFAKAQMAAGVHLPTKGNVFLSVRDGDKE